MSENRNLRVGIIGCGAISRNHLEAFAAVDGAEVVAVCDIDPVRAAAVARRHGVPTAFGSLAELLDHGVDLISVCTPHPTHEDVVLTAAAAGVHVLCEKPIATDLASAERMVTACDAAGVQLGVLFQRRFWPAAQRMRGELDNPEVGAPILGQCSVLLHRDHTYYSRDAWRGTWLNDGGGVLMTQAIHYIDLLQWLMGEVAEVYGRINTFKHGEHIEVEDSAVATLVFASGALATIQATTAATPALGARVQITGEHGGTVSLTEFPEGTDGRVDTFAVGQTITAKPAHPAGVAPNADLSAINGQLIPHHTAQVRDFVHAIKTGTDPSITGAGGTAALRILLAVYESARIGRPVRFADVDLPVVAPDSVSVQPEPARA
ncbi:Gfo/Idh/MocA family protein [Corynebacterium halotolerans]|uniref:Gfo/Idh/MocA family protein n=1 Tax=Corynebacterium halotolerans TaxID=225326 RepID=UPI003CF70300